MTYLYYPLMFAYMHYRLFIFSCHLKQLTKSCRTPEHSHLHCLKAKQSSSNIAALHVRQIS